MLAPEEFNGNVLLIPEGVDGNALLIREGLKYLPPRDSMAMFCFPPKI